MQNYYAIKTESCFVTEVKRSKFIANSFLVSSEQDTAQKLQSIRKKYADASHNCYAYILSNGNSKTSDDKEPSKTAGYPIFEAIKGKNLSDTMVIVTRYFGGVKLGTGGLARAYKDAATAVLEQSGIVNYIYSVQYTVVTDYTTAAASENAINEYGTITAKNYDIKANITAVCPDCKLDEVINKINGITCGKAEISVKEKLFYRYNNC